MPSDPMTPAPDPDACWHYETTPTGRDAGKIVTLLEDGMVWVGIRAFNHAQGIWMNNNEPEKAQVLAWQHLPEPATKRWVGGKLI